MSLRARDFKSQRQSAVIYGDVNCISSDFI
jgi:hypothetical protein